MARALGLSVRLEQMLELASEEALKALNASSVSISCLKPGTGSLHTIINVGDLAPSEERWPENEVYEFDDYPQAQALVADLRTWVTHVDDPDGDPGELALLHKLGKQSSMAAPLVVDGRLWGEFYASRGERLEHFSAMDIAYIEALAAILAGAISRAIHFETLEQLAFRDPLTGLANRRALDDATAQVLGRLAEGPGRRVTAVAVDVNGLKLVNDTAGHAAGDQLLTAIAGLLVRHFSPLVGSLVARMGGDEFTVLVPHHEVTAVMTAADAFCFAAAGLSAGAGVSCGVATATGSEPWLTATSLFRSADEAQYEAKRRGSRTAVLAGQTLSGNGDRLGTRPGRSPSSRSETAASEPETSPR
jgi:diguanylate cyclase (GGDEF)-like protein